MRFNRLMGKFAQALVLIVALTVLIGNPSLLHVSAQDDDPTPVPSDTPIPTITPSIEIDTALTLAPTGDLNGDGEPSPGDTLLYTFRIRNSGESLGPLTIIAQFPAEFVSSVSSSSAGQLDNERGQVAWQLNSLEAGGLVDLSYEIILRRRLRPGINQVGGAVFALLGSAEVARATVIPLQVIGPNLQLLEEVPELSTDVNRNGRIDPGDTVRFVIAYQNTGGGVQQASLSVEFPDELVSSIVANPDGGEEVEGGLIWLLGDVEPTAEPQSVQFSIVLADSFPQGVNSFDLKVALRSTTTVLDESTTALLVAGPNLVVFSDYMLSSDADQDGLADVGDTLSVSIDYRNIGTEPATNVALEVRFVPAHLQVMQVSEDGTPNNSAGTATWPIIDELPTGGSQVLDLALRVLSLPPQGSTLELTIVTLSDETSEGIFSLSIPIDETARPAATPSLPATIIEERPVQGQGILSGTVIALLIGGFLVLSFFSIVFVGSRVLPGTLQERMEIDDPDERAAQRRLVRELVEGVVLTAILFSVMLLGLQNALDQNSISSIIAGIVGYVAGRISSRK